jgi:hypothetical protein
MTDRFISNRRQLFGAAGQGFLAGLLANAPGFRSAQSESNIYQRIGVQADNQLQGDIHHHQRIAEPAGGQEGAR